MLSIPCEDIIFRAKAFNYLVFYRCLHDKFRWEISFYIRYKSRSVTFSLAPALTDVRT